MTEKRCPSGKRVILTESEAKVELVGVIVERNRGKSKRRECRWYHCGICHYYHLTSQPHPTKEKTA